MQALLKPQSSDTPAPQRELSGLCQAIGSSSIAFSSDSSSGFQVTSSLLSISDRAKFRQVSILTFATESHFLATIRVHSSVAGSKPVSSQCLASGVAL